MDELTPQIRHAINTFDVPRARELLREALQQPQPSAEVYYLAALVALSQPQKIDFLEKALEVDPHHAAALAELEHIAPAVAAEGMVLAPESDAEPEALAIPAPFAAAASSVAVAPEPAVPAGPTLGVRLLLWAGVAFSFVLSASLTSLFVMLPMGMISLASYGGLVVYAIGQALTAFAVGTALTRILPAFEERRLMLILSWVGVGLLYNVVLTPFVTLGARPLNLGAGFPLSAENLVMGLITTVVVTFFVTPLGNPLGLRVLVGWMLAYALATAFYLFWNYRFLGSTGLPLELELGLGWVLGKTLLGVICGGVISLLPAYRA